MLIQGAPIPSESLLVHAVNPISQQARGMWPEKFPSSDIAQRALDENGENELEARAWFGKSGYQLLDVVKAEPRETPNERYPWNMTPEDHGPWPLHPNTMLGHREVPAGFPRDYLYLANERVWHFREDHLPEMKSRLKAAPWKHRTRAKRDVEKAKEMLTAAEAARNEIYSADYEERAAFRGKTEGKLPIMPYKRKHPNRWMPN